jgi:hypothetical protein
MFDVKIVIGKKLKGKFKGVVFNPEMELIDSPNGAIEYYPPYKISHSEEFEFDDIIESCEPMVNATGYIVNRKIAVPHDVIIYL